MKKEIIIFKTLLILLGLTSLTLVSCSDDEEIVPENRNPANVMEIITGSNNHGTLAAAIGAAGLTETLRGPGPFTVFAPTDAAFAALPAGTVEALLADPSGKLTDILLYHVAGAKALSSQLSNDQQIVTVFGETVSVTINNDGVFINGARVTAADIEAENGVVHVIDAVLIPQAPMPATVVDIVAGSPDHQTLTAAVTAAGLADALSGAGPFTVFAPTDAAFAALPAGTVESLLEDPTGDLANILMYHVVSAKALSGDLSDGDVFETLLGGNNITVSINNGSVFINESQVTVADIEAENGVVHVIDAVLIPQAPMPATVVDIVAGSPDHQTLTAAVTAAGLADALSGAGPFTVFAPTDAAFAALPDGTVEALLEDPTGDLANILMYHVVSAKAMSGDLSDGDVFETLLGGNNITVSINNGSVFINESQVTVADIEAENGVVHVIDGILLP